MDADTPLIQITGETQSGKSTLAARLVLERRRVIVGAPFPVAHKYPVEQFSSVKEAYDCLRVAKVSTYRIAVIVQTPSQFQELCWLAWVQAPCTLVLDETKMYLPNPAQAPMEFNYISQAWAHAGDLRGEKREVHVIAIGQRPVNLPPIFRSEVKVWYLFRLNARSDRRMLEDMGLTREQSEKAGTLGPYRYMRVTRYGDVTYGQTSV